MATLQGFKGNIKWAGTTNAVGEMGEWSFEVNRDTYETTKFGLYSTTIPWRTYVAGLLGAQGKFNGNLDMADTNGQLAIWQSLTSETAVTLNLYTDTTPHYFGMSVLITKFSPKTPIDDLETIEFEFIVTGAVSYT